MENNMNPPISPSGSPEADPSECPETSVSAPEKSQELAESKVGKNEIRKSTTEFSIKNVTGFSPSESKTGVIAEKTGGAVKPKPFVPVAKDSSFNKRAGGTIVLSVPVPEEMKKPKDPIPQVSTSFNLEEFPVYSDTRLSFGESAHLILNPEDLDETKFCHQMPPGCPGLGVFVFVVDTNGMEGMDDVSEDEHGTWGKPTSRSMYYILSTTTGKYEKLENTKRGKDEATWDVRVQQMEYYHPFYSKGKFVKTITIALDTFGDPLQWATLQYTAKVSPRTNPVKLPVDPAKVRKTFRFADRSMAMAAKARLDGRFAVRKPWGNAAYDGDLGDANLRYVTGGQIPGYATERGKLAGLCLTKSGGSSILKRIKTENANPRVLALQEAVARLEKEKLERELEVLEIQKQYYSMKRAREERSNYIQGTIEEDEGRIGDTGGIQYVEQDGEQFQMDHENVVDADANGCSERQTQFFSAGRSGRRVKIVYPNGSSTSHINIQ